MFYKCLVVLAVLQSALGSPYWNQEDGRTFNTEYDHPMEVQKAAVEHAYLRFKADLDATGPSGETSLDNHRDLDNFRNYHLNKQHYPSLLKEEAPEPDDPEIHEDDPRFNPFESDSSEDGHHIKEEYDEPRIYKHDQYEYVQLRSPRSNKDIRNGHPLTSPTQNSGESYPLRYNGVSYPLYRGIARHRRDVELYEGPPAPLNKDLTVDFTPEHKHITEAHLAAIEKEYQRLQATAALAAAYPDRTSPPSKDYNPQNTGQHNLFEPQQQGLPFARKKRSYSGQYSPQPSNSRHYDDGQYRPQQYKHDDGQYRPHSHYHYHGQYRPQLHQKVDYNTEPFRPAPLNPDGTVAHVPEYHAIAASHLAAHHQAVSAVSH